MARQTPIRLAHVIPGLEVGGAELLLARLVTGLDPASFSSRVISMTGIGPVGRSLRERGVEVDALAMRGAVPDPRVLASLVGTLRQHRVQVVHSWLYYADLLAGAATRLNRRVPLLWSVHTTSLHRREAKLKTRLAARACALLARWVPDAIVCSSASAAEAHERVGYPHDRMTVVPNGVDTDVFRPDARARQRVRGELGIPEGTQLIGMAARFSPPKDHRTFLRAASRVARERPGVRFVLCGKEMTAANPTLAAWLAKERIEDRVNLLGVRDDMPAIYAALDIATLSSSWSETAPLAVSEAMACGVPCVATAVGDMPRMVADSGLSVAPRDPRALSDAWLQLLDEPEESRRARGRAARCRIERDYSLRGMVERYASVYGQLVDVA